jgi:hypothetical protein
MHSRNLLFNIYSSTDAQKRGNTEIDKNSCNTDLKSASSAREQEELFESINFSGSVEKENLTNLADATALNAVTPDIDVTASNLLQQNSSRCISRVDSFSRFFASAASKLLQLFGLTSGAVLSTGGGPSIPLDDIDADTKTPTSGQHQNVAAIRSFERGAQAMSYSALHLEHYACIGNEIAATSTDHIHPSKALGPFNEREMELSDRHVHMYLNVRN